VARGITRDEGASGREPPDAFPPAADPSGRARLIAEEQARRSQSSPARSRRALSRPAPAARLRVSLASGSGLAAG